MPIHSLDSAVTRRSFLTAAGGAFLLGCTFEVASAQSPGSSGLPLNAWIRIDPDNTVVLVVAQAEIGQGIATTMPAIIADELGADWAHVRLENSPTDPAYRNPRINWQFTGNSESTSSFFDLMREMGAGALPTASRWLPTPGGARISRSRRSISPGTTGRAPQSTQRSSPSKLNVHTAGDKAAFGQVHPTNLSAEYGSQFMAHATMEPMNCTASVTADGCDIWAPTQGQEMTQMVLSQVLGLPKERVRVGRTFAGGGFGRRLVADFAVQAALVSKAVQRPVKVVWTREEDMQHDLYRPAVANRLAAGIDEFGRLRTLYHQVVSPSILQYVYPAAVKPDFDPSCLEGTLETHYKIPNIKVDFKLLKMPVPTSVLRTTGFGPNLFAMESFIDELAHLSGKDPYLYRRDLLGDDKRALTVLDLAAEESQWRQPLKPGHYRGIAFCEAFQTFTCHGIELSMEGNAIHIHRVVAAIDAGNTLDPGISANSIEGGVAWGLTCAMKSEITFANGRTVESNFHDYPVVRMFEMPPIEVHFIESGARPLGGVGEVGPVTVIPALTNALFAATGVRYRSSPLSRFGLALA
jgi:isoquinoline 1-oxidoreductase beta subunit